MSGYGGAAYWDQQKNAIYGNPQFSTRSSGGGGSSVNAYANMSNPYAGMSNPYAGTANPYANMSNPYAGMSGNGRLGPSALQPRLQQWNQANPMSAKLGPQAGQWGAVGATDPKVSQYMSGVLGQQRNMVDDYSRRMAQSGINRNARGMGVAGGVPLETALGQQGVAGLAQGVGQNFRDAMSAAQNDWKMSSDAQAALRGDQVRMLGLEQTGEANRWDAEAKLRDWRLGLASGQANYGLGLAKGQSDWIGDQANYGLGLAKGQADYGLGLAKGNADWAMNQQNNNAQAAQLQLERDKAAANWKLQTGNQAWDAMTKEKSQQEAWNREDKNNAAKVSAASNMVGKSRSGIPWLDNWHDDRWGGYAAFTGMGLNAVNPGGGR